MSGPITPAGSTTRESVSDIDAAIINSHPYKIEEMAKTWKDRQWVPLDAAISELQFWQLRDIAWDRHIRESEDRCERQCDDRIRKWRDQFEAMHQRAMRAEDRLRAIACSNEPAVNAVERLANVRMDLDLAEWSKLSAVILAGLGVEAYCESARIALSGGEDEQRLRAVLNEIDFVAGTTVRPDGSEAAWAALDAIIALIHPFRTNGHYPPRVLHPNHGVGHADEFMSVSITREGVVTSHNAYDANFDEMVEATRKIVASLQERIANRLKCPFAAGNELRATTSSPDASPDSLSGGAEEVGTLAYLESEARRFAGLYPEASDGRNTFLIFADKVAALHPSPEAPANRQEAVEADYPAGAIENGREFLRRLGGYDCAAGLISMSVDHAEAVRCFEWLVMSYDRLAALTSPKDVKGSDA